MSDAEKEKTKRFRKTVDSTRFSAKGMRGWENEVEAAKAAQAAGAGDGDPTDANHIVPEGAAAPAPGTAADPAASPAAPAAASTAAAGSPPGEPIVGAPRLGGTNATDRLRRNAKVPDTARYRVDSLLGVGSTGQIYSVYDRSLERPVAVKVLKPEFIDSEPDLTSFVEEARLTASMSHPNVLPVHEFDVTQDGLPYFSMSRIKGRSFDQILAESTIGKRHPAIGNFNLVVSVIIGACNAIAYAHHLGIIHQDVKPDNIMIGDFGEVLLLDWGSAARLGADGHIQGRIYGTPLYMSPEQARRDHADRQSDIYCLGATLFHALTLRLPMWDDNPERFWEKKRRGDLDELTPAERSVVPAQLLGIALKAMAAAPAERYVDVKELVADLQSWQAGMAVSAYRDPALVRFRRWRRRHARVLWTAAMFALVLVGVGIYLYGQSLKEIASWGAPIVAEDFNDPSWQSRWTETAPGTFGVVDGHAVSKGDRASFLVYNKRLTGSIAIEFDGTIPSGVQPGDLSVIWCEGNVFATAQPQLTGRSVWFQTGALDNVCAMILTSNGMRQSLTPLRLEPGRTYRIRAVIEGTHHELQVDGKVVGVYDDIFPANSGYLALYGYYPGKVFDNVRIYNRGVAQKISALAVGDSLYELGLFDQASVAYQRVVDSQPGTGIADQGVYRQGLCQLVQGRWDSAVSCWSRVKDPDLKLQVRIHDLDHLASTRRLDLVERDFAPLYREHPELRGTMRNHWRSWLGSLDREPPVTSQPLLTLANDLFPSEPDCEDATLTLMSRLGKWEEAVRRFPGNGFALLLAGHYADLIAHHQEHLIAHCTALFETGEFDAALTTSKQYDWLYRPLLLGTRRYDQYAHEFGVTPNLLLMNGEAAAALAAAKPDEVAGAVALLQLGRRDEALARADGALATVDNNELWRSWIDTRNSLLIYLGRSSEAIPRAYELEQRHAALTGAILDSAIAGDLGKLPEQLRVVRELPWSQSLAHAWFEHVVVVPMLAGLASGDPAPTVRKALAEALGASAAAHHARVGFFARLVQGKISDEEFLAQPFKPGVAGALALGHAIASDLDGRVAEALAGYRAYLALPMSDRGVDGVELAGDPLMERFAIWRAGALQAAGAQ